eukprot:Clim_evm14s15 gene=Clim_evmTU14s15
MSSWTDRLRRFAAPYYAANLSLILAWPAVRYGEYTQHLWPEAWSMETKEREIMMLAAIVTAFRTQRDISTEAQLATIFTFSKLAIAVMCAAHNMIYAAIWLVAAAIVHFAFPQPMYKGPENVKMLSPQEMERVLGNKNETWIIEFFTTWHPKCIAFAPVWAKLSEQYGSRKLKFGKVDVGRYRIAAQKMRINDEATTKQIPTVAIFHRGVVFRQLPELPKVGSAQQDITAMKFSEELVRDQFELQEVSKKGPAASLFKGEARGAGKEKK